jgi:4-hydroxy-tetrahydrodipicolinate synthase
MNAPPAPFARLIPAMVTPFTADASAVDWPRVTQLAQDLVAAGCDALLVNGTTGEAPTLTWDEKVQLVKTVQQAVAGLTINGKPVPVMTGAGSNNTAKSVDEAQAMAALGVDALLVVVPYYNKPSQRGMLAHYSAVAQAVANTGPQGGPTPMMIYNIPGRCGTQMAADTMAELHARYPYIMGVKQSVADLDAATEIRSKLPETFQLWSGDDSLTLPMMAVGACGVVSVAAHVVGRPIRQMIDDFLAGQVVQAQGAHYCLFNLFRELFFLPNPTVVKTLLAQQGRLAASFREPMVPPSPEELSRIAAIISAYNLVPQPVSI